MTHISREYAEALFQLALEDGNTEAFAEGLDLAERELKNNPAFLSLLASPAIPREERMEALSAAFRERMPMPELILLRLMVYRGHARQIGDMIACYRDLAREQRGESVAMVTTAVPLTAEETEKLRAKLEARFGRKIVINCQVDPALLGGIRVETEGRVLDGILKTRLHEIKEVMDS